MVVTKTRVRTKCYVINGKVCEIEWHLCTDTMAMDDFIAEFERDELTAAGESLYGPGRLIPLGGNRYRWEATPDGH